MNTRQLAQGLMPTAEYERTHTYHSLRQFPELRRTVNDMKLIPIRRRDDTNTQNHSQGLARSKINRSTYKLDELSKSSVDEVSAMTDYRRVLLENRRKLKHSTLSTSSVGTLPPLTHEEDSLDGSVSAVDAADRKLAKVSISFDAGSYNSHLAGFSGRRLDKKEFHTQLRRCLNINLKKSELYALFDKMDVDKSGEIDGVEFIRYFFALGTQARWQMQIETMSRRSKKQEDERALFEEKLLQIKEWESSQVAKFTEYDTASAMAKLEDAAFKWDQTNYIESTYVKGFEAYLTPYDFKLQVERSFNIKLTGAELGSIIKRYSTRPGEHCIDGYTFLKHFCSLREKKQREFAASKIRFQQKKERILNMGQHIDILPKLLGDEGSTLNRNSEKMSSQADSAAAKQKRRESGVPAPDTDSIKVICRFRPARAPRKDQAGVKGTKLSSHSDSFNLDEKTGEVEFSSDYQESKRFKFDKIFGGESKQADIFGEVSSTIDFVMDGFNGAVLAYGQTSAGKSWTMEGPSIWDSDFQGVVPRSVDKLFEDIEKAPSTVQFQIIVSYYEIYCEKVRDLLNPTQTNMKVRETKADGFIVQDVTEVYCTDKESVLRVIELGKTNRVAAPTLMNAESSRSHSIFSILVDQQDTANGRHKKGILYLVDLAGSEKVGKTGAKGIRLEEAKNINSSLTSLGMVINALCDRAPHVPYRDSKLTMLLMEALGGNSKTTLIICCTPEHDHSPETLSTLRFGERAKHIQTNARVNEELSAAELKVHLQAAKKELANLVVVLGKTAQGISEAVTSASTTNLVPLQEFLRKHLSRMGAKNGPSEAATLDTETAVVPSDDRSSEDMVDGSQSVKHKPLDQTEQMADLASKVTSLEEEVELEKLRFEKEHEMFMFKNEEVSALQATIAELEEKLLKANLQAKRAQEAKEMAEELLNTATQAAANATAAGSSVEGGNAVSSSSDDACQSPDHATSPSHQRLRTSSFLGRSSLSPGAAPRLSLVGSASHDKNEAKDMTDRKEAGIAAENREFLLKLERELIATGTNLEKDGSFKVSGSGADPLQAFDQATRDKQSNLDREKDNAELMKFLDIGEGELNSPTSDADAQKHVKEVYGTHVRRLMFILDQEQQARLRVEDKLDDMKMQMVRQNSVKQQERPKSKSFLSNLFSGGNSSSASSGGQTGANDQASTLSTISHMLTDTISPVRNRQASVGAPMSAEENAKRYGYNDREAALAETLEIAQDRIMDLVAEMESTQEAQAIVLETKESVLRSLARQNTHLAMERDALNQKVDALTAKTEQLSSLLRSVQQAQVQAAQPLSSSVHNQSFRTGGNTVPRLSSVRTMATLDTSYGGGEGGPKSVHNASFRMGGKPPMTPSAVVGGFSAPRTPLFFNGGGTIQRNRTPRANPLVAQPGPGQANSPTNMSIGTDSTNSSCNDLTRLDSPSPSPLPSSALGVTPGSTKESSSASSEGESRFDTPMDLNEELADTSVPFPVESLAGSAPTEVTAVEAAQGNEA